MRLVTPTDFDILEALDDGYRNNAVNLAEILGRDRQYINTRLPALLDYGLVERIGPADNSGLGCMRSRRGGRRWWSIATRMVSQMLILMSW